MYEVLKADGLSKVAIAAFMGNIQAESKFSTAMSGDQGSVGLCQWLNERATNLKKYAAAQGKSVTDVTVQANFILQECKDTAYKDPSAASCYKSLATLTVVETAADYVTALYERPYFKNTWADVVNACATTSWLSLDRFSEKANAKNGKFYLDTPGRRGYSESYYACILKM